MLESHGYEKSQKVGHEMGKIEVQLQNPPGAWLGSVSETRTEPSETQKKRSTP